MTSFMFESGIGSLNQALYHMNKYHETKDHHHLRFVLIHLDGAFELIIKKSLIDKGIDVIAKYGNTKGILDCLDEVKKDIKKSNISENFLNQITNLNEVTFLHKFRNNAQHLGSITKEEQLIEIIPKALESMKAYLKVYFDYNNESLDSYMSGIGIDKDPMQLYIDEANNAYYAGELEIAYIKKFNTVDRIIRELNMIIFGRKFRGPSSKIGYIIDELTKTEYFKKKISSKNLKELGTKYEVTRELKMLLAYDPEKVDQEELLIAWSELNTLDSIFLDMYLYIKSI